MAPRSQVHGLFLAATVAALLAACSGPAERTARYLERGEDYLTAGNLEKAQLEFRNALQTSPNIAQVRYQNATLEERLGNYARAAQLYQGTLDLEAHHQQARQHLARLYLLGGDAAQALKLIEPGLVDHPDSADLLAYRAAARESLHDSAAALADGEQAVKLAPGNETAVTTLAGIYANANRDAEALALLEGTLLKLPNSSDLRQVLAQFYATHNDIPKAEQMLKELVALQPKERAHRLSLARFYVGTDRVDDAEKALREALALSPDDRGLRGALLDFLVARRGRPVAEQEVARMIVASPKDYDLQLLLGTYQEQDGAAEQATASYNKIIAAQEKKPAALTARVRLGVMAWQRKDLAAARTLANDVLAVNPRDPDALALRSQLSLAGGDTKSAIVDLRAVVRDHPENVAAQRQLARAYLVTGESQLAEDTLRQAMTGNPDDDTARTDLVDLYLQTGRVQPARSLVEALVARDPRNPDFLQRQFRVLASLKEYAAAEASAAAMRRAHPELSMGWYLSGLLAEAQGHDDEALRQYDHALDLDGRVQEPLAAEVKLLVRNRQAARAVARITDLLTRYPDNLYAVNLRGETLAGMKKWPEATADFELASQKSPEWWVPWRNLAAVRVEQQDVDGGLKILREAAARLGHPDVLVVELTGLLQRLGRVDEAASAYEEVLRVRPDADLVANNLAMLLATARGDATSLARAAQLAGRFAQSGNPNYLDTDGWVLLRQGKPAEALVVLERAAAISPELPVIRYHLALAQFGAGQKQAARDNLERALQARQEFEGMADARARLAQWKQAG